MSPEPGMTGNGHAAREPVQMIGQTCRWPPPIRLPGGRIPNSEKKRTGQDGCVPNSTCEICTPEACRAKCSDNSEPPLERSSGYPVNATVTDPSVLLPAAIIGRRVKTADAHRHRPFGRKLPTQRLTAPFLAEWHFGAMTRSGRGHCGDARKVSRRPNRHRGIRDSPWESDSACRRPGYEAGAILPMTSIHRPSVRGYSRPSGHQQSNKRCDCRRRRSPI